MELDGKLYRKVYKALGKWKELEEITQMVERRSLSPQQAWEQYKALWELSMKIAPGDNDYQHSEHMRYWGHYYFKIQKLQTWMRSHGEAT